MTANGSRAAGEPLGCRTQPRLGAVDRRMVVTIARAGRAAACRVVSGGHLCTASRPPLAGFERIAAEVARRTRKPRCASTKAPRACPPRTPCAPTRTSPASSAPSDASRPWTYAAPSTTAPRSASAPTCSSASSPTTLNSICAKPSRRCSSKTRTSPARSPPAIPWPPRPSEAVRRKKARHDPRRTAAAQLLHLAGAARHALPQSLPRQGVPGARLRLRHRTLALQRPALELVRSFPVDFTR